MSGDEFAPGLRRMMVRRHLTADEEHMWNLVSRTIKPLRHARKIVSALRHKPAGANVVPDPVKKMAPAAPVPKHAPLPRANPVPAAPPIALARREKQQLVRGRTEIDARIDLHGMTQAQAHSALLRFLHQSQSRGAKFVLVITGKGAPNAPRGERGVLRQQVPHWLALPEFRACVLSFDVAHLGHGGEGALYVRLRKAKR